MNGWNNEAGATVGAGTGRRPRARGRRRGRRATDSWNLRFESLGARIPAAFVGQSATLMVVAVEDVCWQLAMDSWRSARPRRWRRRSYATWRAQVLRLEDKRERLRSLVDEALLTG